MQIYHKLYDNKVNTSDEDLEDESQLFDKTNYTVRNVIDLLIKIIPWNELLASEFLLLLR